MTMTIAHLMSILKIQKPVEVYYYSLTKKVLESGDACLMNNYRSHFLCAIKGAEWEFFEFNLVSDYAESDSIG